MPCVTYETPEEIAARLRASEADRESAMERTLGPLHAKIDIQGRQIAELEAMLCGVLSSLTTMQGYGYTVMADGGSQGIYDATQNWFNEEESGVTWYQLENWWQDHQLQDRMRKEAEQQAVETRKQAALAKLTPEERELLGL